MNLGQLVQQVQYQLVNRAWSGSANLIFPTGSVVISSMPADLVLPELPWYPAAVIRPGDSGMDPMHGQCSDIWRARFGVTLAQAVDGRSIGESALIGAHRTAQDESPGRGILEIAPEVLDEIGNLGRVNGVDLRSLSDSIPEPVFVEGDPAAVRMDLIFEARVTRQASYPRVGNFVAADGGGGVANLSWALPGARYDRLEVIVRRAAGGTAPSSVTAGTGVTLGSLLATSVADTPGAGTFSYAVFVGYDEDGDSSSDRYSDARTATVVVT